MADSARSVIQRQWDEEACALMQASADASPWALVEGFTDCLGRAHLLEIRHDGVHALVAVRGLQLEGGRVLEVAGLRSLGVRITPQAVGALENIAREVYGADLISMITRHEHLARTCQRAGWTSAARMVLKPLGLQ